VEHPFDLIHLDLWTSPVFSVSGSKYYLVILNDYTHYSDTFTTLSHFFAYVSTQFGKTVKAIQCDNGHEFDNSFICFFLLSNDTQLRLSCPYMSPQNGKAERIIRSVNNVIRTLLIQASLPGRYWIEVLHTATYMLNCLPTTVIQAVCPHLALFGSAPSYEHLHVFGYTSYPNTTTTAPHKLSPRSTRCVFLGYSVDHEGYRCLDLSTNRLIVSRHVVFNEDNFPLAVSPCLTDLDFLYVSGPMVSTIETHLTTAGTSPLAPHQPAPKISPGFEPPVANLPAPTVPPVFLPWTATMVAPAPVTISPPTRTWPASPVTYVRREVGARAVGTRSAPGAALRREVGARAAPKADSSRAEGAGATGTCDTPGPAPRREVGAGAAGTRGAPGAVLRQDVGTEAAVTHGGPGAALRREVGAGANGTCGGPGATLSREPGTTPPPSSAPFRTRSGCGATCHTLR
jgi:hypothetical protein